MWNHAFLTVLYEIACRTLPRVQLKSRPGVIGLVLQDDTLAGTTQIHWGVSDREVFRSWQRKEDVEEVVNHWSSQIGEYTEVKSEQINSTEV